MPPKRIASAPQDLNEISVIDPGIEVLLHETSMETTFRTSEPEDFALAAALSEDVQGKPLIAQTMAK